MVQRLFYQDLYQKEFDAKVLTIEGNRVMLDQTCFFPQGGGQIGDMGEIGGVRVIDTQKEDKGLVHILEKEPDFKVGDMVHGKIDWERRYKIMKLHSAAHIVFYFMQEVFGSGCKPLSSGIVDDKKDRSDYAFEEKLDQEKLKLVERKANEFISQGHEISTWSDETNPDTRYWKCCTWTMPCGGTHPKNTVEIGKIIVSRGKKPGAGKERIEICLSE